MEKRALITGITGQDGSYLAELLLRKGYEVFGLARRLSVPNFNNITAIRDRITILEGDLADGPSLHRAVVESSPTEVYNLAAQSFVHTSFRQPIVTADLTGVAVFRLLETVRSHAPHARFYQASSSEMFGKVKADPQNEETPFHPRSPYGVAKVMGYYAAVNYRESYGLHASNGILFNHESPRRGAEFVTRKISLGVARIAAGLQKDLVMGNLDAVRDWGYAPEYMEGVWSMLQQKEPGDYVQATGVSYSVRDFLRFAFQAAGIDDWEQHVRVDPKFERPAEVVLLRGDASKAKAKFGWKATTHAPELAKIMVRADMAALAALEGRRDAASIRT
ncbi:MAG: GDP-mannose 4,6-dehydratase [Thermoplasmatota archaeon]